MSRPLLVVNPASGGGAAGAAFAEMRPAIERALGAVDVLFTERSGHAIDLARDAAAAGRSLIVAVGGDGTLHEVVNGVLGARRAEGPPPEVGVIGQGTGGDFARTLGLAHRLDAYLGALAHGKARSVDVGRLRYRDRAGKPAERFFVNIVSAGMSGLVDTYVKDGSRALGGKGAYFAASLRALLRCRAGQVLCRSELQGKKEERRFHSYLVAVCNGRYFGAGMHVAPMAAIDDGRFEVVSMGAANKVAFAVAARKIYDAGHLRAEGVVHFACDHVTLDLQGDDARSVFLLDVDGEPLGGLPIEIELLPGALSIRA